MHELKKENRPRIMKRILIIGSGGAGKSRFAKKIGEITKIEVINLDYLYWKPGWIKPSKKEWKTTVEKLIQKQSWIMDGNHQSTLDTRITAADTIILLDMHPIICLWHIIKRRFTQKEAVPGCPQRITAEFVHWILWKYPTKKRPETLHKLKQYEKVKNIHILHTQKEIKGFLQNNTTSSPIPPDQT
jgi:adenylate kinase family enzyme